MTDRTAAPSQTPGRHLDLLLGPVALCFVCIVVWLGHPAYQNNDDVGIMLFAVGGVPVDYVGALLRDLWHLGYTAAPGVPWYGLSLYAGHVVAVWVWFLLLSRVFRPGWLAALFACLFLACYLPFLLHLSYTSTSMMLCMAGGVWACLLVTEGERRYWRLLTAGAVFMLGMLVRPEAAEAALAYGLPVALLAAAYALRDSKWRTAWRGLGAAALLFFIPAALNQVYETAYWHYAVAPDGARYEAFSQPLGTDLEINRLRRRMVMDDPPLLQALHWDRRQAQDLFKLQFTDERVYNAESLGYLAEHLPPAVLDAASVKAALGRMFSPWPGLTLLLCPLPLFALLLRRHPRFGLPGLLLPMYWLALTGYLEVYTDIQERHLIPFTISYGLACLTLSAWYAQRLADTRKRRLLASLLAAAIALPAAAGSLVQTLQDEADLVARAQAEGQKLAGLNHNYKDAVILAKPVDGLTLERGSPLEVVHLNFQPVMLGWTTFSPAFYHQIGALGISHGYELMDALVDRPDAYLLGDEDWCKAMLQLATDADRRGVHAEQVQRFDDGTGLFRLVSAKR